MGTESNQSALPPEAAMNSLMGGFLNTQMIAVAAELGIADVLSEGPLSPGELAEEVGADRARLTRVMRTLSALGVFAENEAGQFEQTPLSETIRTDAQGSMRDFARLYGQEWYRLPFTTLVDIVRQPSGIAFEQVHGMPMFEYLATDEVGAATFNGAMTSTTQRAESAIMEAYDFTPYGHIVDVGGGHGAMLSAALKSSPASKGTLFDLPEVVADAPSILTVAGVYDRCEIVGGSFFETVPPDADLYILKFIIHDWNDDDAGRILRRVREAIPSDGKLLLIERGIVPDNNDPHPIKFLDMHMLILLDGLERKEAEFRRLLNDSGFELDRVIRTADPMNVLIETSPIS